MIDLLLSVVKKKLRLLVEQQARSRAETTSSYETTAKMIDERLHLLLIGLGGYPSLPPIGSKVTPAHHKFKVLAYIKNYYYSMAHLIL